jgi:2-polyprenyl-3-methyl-5-hydroxy-6-metoxy-1,4-benzoquinol methylase
VKVGEYIRSGIVSGWDTDTILAGIKQSYPDSKASAKDVAWHRGKLKRDNLPLDEAILKSIKERRTARRAADKVFAKAVDIAAADNLRQPTSSKRVVPDREFDQTSLRASAHGEWVHRDYAAHFFRWGFAGRFIDGSKSVLDVGCGPDVPMMRILTMPRNVVPKRYVGVDYNPEPRRHPTRGWGELHWNTDFIRDHKKILGNERFDVVTNFEVIEHMKKTDGEKLLAAMRDHLTENGTILLSTPVFNGKAAANHIHEWTVPEMEASVKKAKLRVAKRFGTFARYPSIKKVATKAEMELYSRIAEYYGGEVMACFLAPLYPDQSSNNIWLLQHA